MTYEYIVYTDDPRNPIYSGRADSMDEAQLQCDTVLRLKTDRAQATWNQTKELSWRLGWRFKDQEVETYRSYVKVIA